MDTSLLLGPPNINTSFKRETRFQEGRGLESLIGHSQEFKSLVWRYFYLEIMKICTGGLLGDRNGVMRDLRSRRRW